MINPCFNFGFIKEKVKKDQPIKQAKKTITLENDLFFIKILFGRYSSGSLKSLKKLISQNKKPTIPTKNK